MFKAICICEKCKKETAAYENENGIFVIDFSLGQFIFNCPKCGHVNTLDYGVIKKALQNKTRLPGIGGSRF